MMAPQATTAAEKEHVRQTILDALLDLGGKIEVDTMKELRAYLDMEDVSMKLFKRSVWHLKTGDRDPEGIRRIVVNQPEKFERFELRIRRRITIRAL